MLRAVLAAIAGYFLIGVLVLFTDQMFTVAIQGFNSMASPPNYYFVLSLLSDTLYSFLGGYLCAAIARAAARQSTLAMLAGGEIMGLAAIIAFWHTVPHWFSFALLIVYPPAVLAGSRLRTRGEPSGASASGA